MVLSGYSQGAAVIAYITTDSVPANYQLPPGITGPMPNAVAGHVAAVTLFGKPSTGFMNMIDRTAPPITIGSGYAGKALDLCIPSDPDLLTERERRGHTHSVRGQWNGGPGGDLCHPTPSAPHAVNLEPATSVQVTGDAS